MSEWNTKPLGEIAENISRPFSFKERGKVIFINTGDVLEGKFLHADYSDVAGLPGQAKKAIKKGDILYSEIRPGNKRYVHVDFDADEYVVSTKFMVIRPTANVSSDFLYMLLTSKACEEEFKIIADSRSGTFPQITFDSVAYYPIRYPSIENQERLVEISNSLLNKIELNRQTNQTLEHIAQAIFKCWFVDFEPTRAKIIVKQKGGNELAQELAAQALICGAITLHKLAELDGGVLGIEKELHQLITKRFPNEGGVDFWQPQQLAAIAALFPNSLVDSELGEVPEGWGVKPLGDYLEIKRGGSPRPIKEYIVDKGIPWTKIADATKEPSPFLFKTKECIREEGLNKTVFLKKGTMILSNSATPGLPKFLELDACIHDGWLHFPQKKLFSDIYLYQLFLEIRKVLVAQGNGSVFTNLKTDILRNQVVVVPSQEVIDQFDTNVALIFEALKQNCKESNMLAEIREILLPKLLSGELAAL